MQMNVLRMDFCIIRNIDSTIFHSNVWLTNTISLFTHQLACVFIHNHSMSSASNNNKNRQILHIEHKSFSCIVCGMTSFACTSKMEQNKSGLSWCCGIDQQISSVSRTAMLHRIHMHSSDCAHTLHRHYTLSVTAQHTYANTTHGATAQWCVEHGTIPDVARL